MPHTFRRGPLLFSDFFNLRQVSFLISQYEEIYSPEVNDFVYITDNAYSPADMRKMELDILKTLDCHLGRPLALHFLRRYSKVGEVDSIQHALAKFFMEVTLLVGFNVVAKNCPSF